MLGFDSLAQSAKQNNQKIGIHTVHESSIINIDIDPEMYTYIHKKEQQQQQAMQNSLSQ